MKNFLVFVSVFLFLSPILMGYQIGDTVSDFTIQYSNGGEPVSRTLHDITAQGRMVMLVYGVGYCSSSIDSAPLLQQIWENIDKENFSLIIGLSDINNWEDLNDDGWGLGFDTPLSYGLSVSSELSSYYWSFGNKDTPYYVIVDTDNVLRYSGDIMPAEEYISNLIKDNEYNSVPVYRFFNTLSGGHLYTISDIERDIILNDLPHWNYEGTSFEVYLDQASDTVPSYRFFNTNNGIHLYTISEHERDYIIDNLPEWLYEGVSFYVYPDETEETIPVFRFFNSVHGGHLYTISEHERDNIIDNLPEWDYEGISFYIYERELKYAYIPRTGQTRWYYSGDDGYYQMGIVWPKPRFIDHGDGTVTDKLTGLMWTRDADIAGDMTWDEAIDWCKDLELAGYNEWRLPNIRELYSLIDISEGQPALPEDNPFLNVQTSNYWSSTTSAGSPDSAWRLNMAVGTYGGANKSEYTGYVWAVHGVSNGEAPLPRTGQTETYRDGDDGYYQMGLKWPDPRFTDNDDGTVTDNLTGLMWSRTPYHGETVWWSAISYCNNLVYMGYSDWRLPNIREIQSLIDFGEMYPALSSGHPFFDIPSYNVFHWSSSIVRMQAGHWDDTWAIRMDIGYVWPIYHIKKLLAFVWPVRGGN